MKFPSILVIGGGGFIGRHVIEALLHRGVADLSDGARRAPAREAAALPVRTIACDLTDRHSVDTAMNGKSVVINCARGTDADSPAAISNLLESAADNGVRRLIQFSSIAVYGDAPGLITEDTPLSSPRHGYAADKIAIEAACRAAAGDGLKIAVLRPSLVYGPFGEEWILQFVRRALTGQLHDLGPGGDGDANLVYVGDLARFCAELTIRDVPEFSVFNVNGDQIPTFNEYFEALSHAAGCGELTPLRRGPRGWEFRRRGRSLARRVIGKLPRRVSTAPPLSQIMKSLTPSALDDHYLRFGQKVAYSNSRAKSYGFDPSTTIEAGIFQTIAANGPFTR